MTVVRRRFASRLLISLSVLMLVPALCAAARIVAVADVHGDFDSFQAMLRDAGLIDTTGRWSGGKTILVQTGDLLDRGPNSRGVLDLLMSLEKQAPKAGGKVIVLLGNHEVMNLTGDLRYTSAREFAAFADENSPRRRQAALDQYTRWRKQHGRPELDPQAEQDWLEQHPLGYVEHREAFGPKGTYGKWLRRRPAVALVGDTLFVHGGIPPKLASTSPQQINDSIAGELRAFDAARAMLIGQKAILAFFNLKEITEAAVAMAGPEAERAQAHPRSGDDPVGHERRAVLRAFLRYPEWLSINREGPLWFRGFSDWTDDAGAAAIPGILAAQHAARIVVGHSTQMGGVRSRWNGSVLLIDTGMSQPAYPGGRRSALEIDGARLTAIYADSRVTLVPQTSAVRELRTLRRGGGEEPQQTPTEASPTTRTWLGPDGNPLPFKTDAEVLEFLKTAKVIKDSAAPGGVAGARKLLLEKDGIRAEAAFRSVNEDRPTMQLSRGATELFFRDSYIFEPAAYELSLLLDMNNVPPATLRRHGGDQGSIQIWVEKAMTEFDRKNKNIAPPNLDYWNKQLSRMNVFDALIFNTDRNRGNVLITPEWNVWLIDHTRAFRRNNQLQVDAQLVQCERTLFEKIKALDEKTLRERLGPYLRKPELTALLLRRDLIVRRFQQLISEKGEAAVLFTLTPPGREKP